MNLKILNRVKLEVFNWISVKDFLIVTSFKTSYYAVTFKHFTDFQNQRRMMNIAVV